MFNFFLYMHLLAIFSRQYTEATDSDKIRKQHGLES